MTSNTWVSDTVSALAFFTRLPLPAGVPLVSVADAARAVPFAAFVTALPAALILLLGGWLGVSPLVAAGFAVATLTVITGALHEDGLADCADGFWGGATRERRLEIMRDSRIGTYGVLALVLAVLLKVALLAELMNHSAFLAASAIVAAAVAGRALALFPWITLPYARSDGVAVAVGKPSQAGFRLAVILGGAISAVLLLWQVPLAYLVAGVGSMLVVKGLTRLANTKVGGVTGDVIGATVMMADLSFLALLVICLG